MLTGAAVLRRHPQEQPDPRLADQPSSVDRVNRSLGLAARPCISCRPGTLSEVPRANALGRGGQNTPSGGSVDGPRGYAASAHPSHWARHDRAAPASFRHLTCCQPRLLSVPRRLEPKVCLSGPQWPVRRSTCGIAVDGQPLRFTQGALRCSLTPTASFRLLPQTPFSGLDCPCRTNSSACGERTSYSHVL